MAGTFNATPRVEYEGINDLSRRPPVQVPETYPQHLPLLRLFTQTGPSETTLIGQDSDAFNTVFGPQTLARRSPYFNLQSLLAELNLAAGNSIFVKRLIPEDAPAPARIIVALDIVADRISKTTSTLSGFDYPADTDDEEVVINAEEETVLGYRGRIVLIEDNGSDIGTQKVVDGSFVADEDGTQSKLYPLFELPTSFVGSMGNFKGLRLWSPTTSDSIPYDDETATQFQTRMYRMQFMQRDSVGSSPSVVKTALGDNYVDVCFTEGAYSEANDIEYYAPQVLVSAYQDDGVQSGTTPLYSPFSEFYLYKENLADVQQMIYEKELELNPAAAPSMIAPGQVDVFTGVDIDGNRYHSLLLEGSLNGGVELGQDTTIYASGGGDGTLNLEEYEKLVVAENNNFGELDPYQNMAVYPFSVLYDTGLSMEGKYSFIGPLAVRKDLRTVFTTYVESEGRAPTAAQEMSRAQSIMTRLRAQPESFLYSTPVCRAEILLQTGRLAEGGYSKPVPVLHDYAYRWTQLGGAGTGMMREGMDIDVTPNNQLTYVRDLNVDFFNDRAKTQLWNNGAILSQSFDRRSLYYTALRSVYADDTSVLVSPITVAICCDVQRLVYTVHAAFSGNAKWTREQFIERSDDRIRQLTNGRYNDRVVIVPETYFTEADDQRGYSWHCKVTVYANNPRTVMTLELETRRMEDLTNG